jgi:hypothetical protein
MAVDLVVRYAANRRCRRSGTGAKSHTVRFLWAAGRRRSRRSPDGAKRNPDFSRQIDPAFRLRSRGLRALTYGQRAQGRLRASGTRYGSRDLREEDKFCQFSFEIEVKIRANCPGGQR